jgi:type V secretory pathway adhesin AidA
VNYATPQKPRRQDFATDDDFGEAYAIWMMRQSKQPQSPAKVTSTATVARTAPAAPPKPSTDRVTARSEIERDTWNQHTKARFMRAKDAVQSSKK